MALTDQPYLPLFVDDWMNNSKLKMCSPAAHGLMISIMCIMHKSEQYGKIELKAKFKQNESKKTCFVKMLSRMTCFDTSEIEVSFHELIDEKILYIDGDFLCSSRMIKDGYISAVRSKSGTQGGKIGRNSGTKRYYNDPGFLYLIVDKNDRGAFKVGISKDPDKRIGGIIRKTKRDGLHFHRKWEVSDMGSAEEEVLNNFKDIRDGEWIFGDFEPLYLEQQISSIIKSKTKANSGNENENENENESGNMEGKGGEGEKPSEHPEITEERFIKIFGDARQRYDNLSIGYSKLDVMERQAFRALLPEFTKQDFFDAVEGLFFQDTVKAVRVRPKWLLERRNFETMIDCWKNQSKIYNGGKSAKNQSDGKKPYENR